MKPRLPVRTAFTLIELLVVVAIIALLISILLPSIESARAQAQTVVCGTHMHDIGSTLNIYANEFNDWLPGAPGTSGVALASESQKFGEVSGFDWEDKAYVAMSAWDWASPLAYYGFGYNDLPKDRRLRWLRIHEGTFKCPSNRFLATVYPAVHQGSIESGHWPVTPLMSYGTTRGFMYFPYGQGDSSIAMPGSWTMRLPQEFRPRRTAVARAASKIYLAEGTRYIDSDSGPSYNVEYEAAFGGSFSTGGPPSGYSRGYINPVEMDPLLHDPKFDRYSYRHRSGGESGMQNLFFDSHVEPLTKEQAISGIDYWWPSNTAMETDGSDVLEFMSDNPGNYNPKPRASYVGMQRPVQSGEPWDVDWDAIIIN